MQHKSKFIPLALAAAAIAVGVYYGPQLATDQLEMSQLTGTLGRQPVLAEGWHSVGGQVDGLAPVSVQKVGEGDFRLVYELSGFQLQSVSVGGRLCSRIGVPGLVKNKVAGWPELPMTGQTLAIADGGTVRFEIVEHVVREMKTDPVEPSKGFLSRNVDPATVVARFGEFYDTGDVWPAAPVVLNETFMLQKQSGVNLRISPVRYDAGRGLLLVTERLVVDVIVASGIDESVLSAELTPVSKALFGSSLPDSPTKYNAIPTLGRMLIITPEALATSVAPLANWKRQRGIPTEVVTVPNTGVFTDHIAEIITTFYHDPVGLVWVILVGDRAEMPPAVGHYDGSDSDIRYAMVDGDDLYPDLFVSRISASTPEQVSTQVNKFIAYEKTPATGAVAAWYRRAAMIASDEGTPKDSARTDLLRVELLLYGYQKVTQIYENQDGSTALILETVNQGASLINYLGHSSGFAWQSVPFGQNQLDQLAPTTMLPWIIDGSCSNGDLALSDCFAEAWLRAGTPLSPAGAVGMIAASSLTPWVPPTVMQSEIINLLTTEQAFTLGALYFSGLMQVADHYAGLPVAEQVVEQNIIFGDCSLQVRTKAPAEFVVDCPVALAPDATYMPFEVAGPVGSVLTLTHGGELYATAFVGVETAVAVPVELWASGVAEVTVTVTGINMVPWLATVALGGGAATEVVSESVPSDRGLPAAVILRGNFPNPFNPMTRIQFELPQDSPVNLKLYNVRGQLVRDLSADMLSAGGQEVLWDGQNQRGLPAPSGVYLYKLEAVGQTLAGRMTLSK